MMYTLCAQYSGESSSEKVITVGKYNAEMAESELLLLVSLLCSKEGSVSLYVWL